MTGPTYKNIRSAPWVLTLRFPSNGSKRTMLFGLSQWLGIFVLINPSSSLLEPSSFKSDQLINQKSVVWVFFFFFHLTSCPFFIQWFNHSNKYPLSTCHIPGTGLTEMCKHSPYLRAATHRAETDQHTELAS